MFLGFLFKTRVESSNSTLESHFGKKKVKAFFFLGGGVNVENVGADVPWDHKERDERDKSPVW